MTSTPCQHSNHTLSKHTVNTCQHTFEHCQHAVNTFLIHQQHTVKRSAILGLYRQPVTNALSTCNQHIVHIVTVPTHRYHVVNTSSKTSLTHHQQTVNKFYGPTYLPKCPVLPRGCWSGLTSLIASSCVSSASPSTAASLQQTRNQAYNFPNSEHSAHKIVVSVVKGGARCRWSDQISCVCTIIKTSNSIRGFCKNGTVANNSVLWPSFHVQLHRRRIVYFFQAISQKICFKTMYKIFRKNEVENGVFWKNIKINILKHNPRRIFLKLFIKIGDIMSRNGRSKPREQWYKSFQSLPISNFQKSASWDLRFRPPWI